MKNNIFKRKIMAVVLAIAMLISSISWNSVIQNTRADSTDSSQSTIQIDSDSSEDNIDLSEVYDEAFDAYCSDAYGLSQDEQEVWNRGLEGDFEVTFDEPIYNDDKTSADVHMTIIPRDSSVKITGVRSFGDFGADKIASASDAILASMSDATDSDATDSDATDSDATDSAYEFDLKATTNYPIYIIYYTVDEDESGAAVVTSTDSDAEIIETNAMDYVWVAVDSDIKDINDTLVISKTSGNDELQVSYSTDAGTWVDVDSVSNIAYWETFTNSKQLKITANFSDLNVAKDRKITINVPDGYDIIGYSAKSDTQDIENVQKIDLSREEDAKLTSSVLTGPNGVEFGSITEDTICEQYSDGTVPSGHDYRNGIITYTFNDNCDMITLYITLNLDIYRIPRLYSADYTIPDPISISMTSGETKLATSMKYKLKAYSLPRAAISTTFTSIRQDTVGLASSGETTFSVQSGISQINSNNVSINRNDRQGRSGTDEYIVTYTYPQGITFVGFKTRKLVNVSAPNSTTYNSDHLVVTHDTTNRKITFTFKNVETSHYLNNDECIFLEVFFSVTASSVTKNKAYTISTTGQSK